MNLKLAGPRSILVGSALGGLFRLMEAAIHAYLFRDGRFLMHIIEWKSRELELLERSYPGISRLEKDTRGNVILPEMSERELAEVMAEFTKDGL